METLSEVPVLPRSESGGTDKAVVKTIEPSIKHVIGMCANFSKQKGDQRRVRITLYVDSRPSNGNVGDLPEIGGSVRNGAALDIDGYLDRINYTGPRAPTFEAVTRILRAHTSVSIFPSLRRCGLMPCRGGRKQRGLQPLLTSMHFFT
jgi:hypothetical protein